MEIIIIEGAITLKTTKTLELLIFLYDEFNDLQIGLTWRYIKTLYSNAVGS